jgi:hypothetical protein
VFQSKQPDLDESHLLRAAVHGKTASFAFELCTPISELSSRKSILYLHTFQSMFYTSFTFPIDLRLTANLELVSCGLTLLQTE